MSPLLMRPMTYQGPLSFHSLPILSFHNWPLSWFTLFKKIVFTNLGVLRDIRISPIKQREVRKYRRCGLRMESYKLVSRFQ